MSERDAGGPRWRWWEEDRFWNTSKTEPIGFPKGLDVGVGEKEESKMTPRFCPGN